MQPDQQSPDIRRDIETMRADVLHAEEKLAYHQAMLKGITGQDVRDNLKRSEHHVKATTLGEYLASCDEHWGESSYYPTDQDVHEAQDRGIEWANQDLARMNAKGPYTGR